MKTPIRVALTLAIFTLAASASAQERWAFELRGGAAFPTQDMVGDLGTGNGVALGGAFAYSLMPHLGAYLGWDWMHFNPENSFAGADVDFEGTGYVAGLRFQHPVSDAVPFDVWARGGVRYDHLELENADGDLIAGTDREVGFDVGAGVAVTVAERWSVTPGVRYRAISHDVQIAPNTTEKADFRHVVVDVGVAYRF